MKETLSTSGGTEIEGVQCRRLRRIEDARGSFTEVFRADWNLPIAPRQWSVVRSQSRVLRGMHLHRDHDEYFLLVEGRACVGLYDAREESGTYGSSCLLEFGEDEWVVLCFPSGILHGWYFYTDSVHLQAVSEHYGIYHPHDNHGCHWSDPALKIAWPDPEPIISGRAAMFPPLSELSKSLHAG